MNSMQWFTIKILSENDLNLTDYEDYWVNKVKDSSKYEKFYTLSISVLQPK